MITRTNWRSLINKRSTTVESHLVGSGVAALKAEIADKTRITAKNGCSGQRNVRQCLIYSTFAVVSRLGVKATTCKAKDLTFKAKAKDLILEDNKVGYQNEYKSTKTNISLPLCQNLIVDIFHFLNVSSVTFLKHSVMLWLHS